MDTSKTYIRMCDCEELQTGWIKTKGDYAFLSVWGRVGIVGLDDKWASDGHSAGGTLATNYIWLPRQDQLQEMVDGYFVDKLDAIFIGVRDYHFTQRHPKEKEFPFTSMEQLWLAFVMKEKYNKVWDGETWE